MALYKGTQKYTTTLKPSTKNIQPITVTKNGTYSAPTGVDGFNPVIMNSTNTYINMGTHVDSNGVWHRPEEWDDIESIDLTNKHEVYFLCACHLTGTDFFRIRFYGGGTLSWSYGHVSNGVYTLHANSTETTVSSGSYISLFLSNLADDYIVIRIKATSYITSCAYQNWVADANINYAAAFRCQSVLMRYGRMIRGTTLSASATYCLESDNIIDFSQYYQNNTSQAITLANAYENAFSLQRWRYTGWDVAKLKVTSFASMFSNCWCLTDVPDELNLDGWVRSYTTTTASMFTNCYSLNSNISAKNWDLTNVTTVASTFSNCRSVKSIIGTETWNSAPKCTNLSNLFNGCYNMMSAIDLSKCYFGNGTANLTTTASMFSNCQCVSSIDISNMNLSKCTTITYMLCALYSCKELKMGNITPISQTCTNTSYLIGYSGIPELIFDGWNFSGNTTAFLTYGFYYSMGTKKIVFRNCTAPSGVTINDTTACAYFRYAYNLKYLDVSFLDMSVFSNTKTHAESFRDLYNLVDFYPPTNISQSFNLSNDLQLSHDSLVRVITNLKTVTTTQTLTVGAYNLAKLSDAEKAVATGKGWTLA